MTTDQKPWRAEMPDVRSSRARPQYDWCPVGQVRLLRDKCNSELDAARAHIKELEDKNLHLLDMLVELHGKLDRRPMECAPRDGKQVLLYDKYEDAFVSGEWLEKRKMWLCGYDANGDWNLCADGDFSGWWPWPEDAVESPKEGT